LHGVTGRDAAFPAYLQGYPGVISGYYGGPDAYNVWSAAQWSQFAGNPKMPIWVGGFGGATEGEQAVLALQNLGVPQNVLTVLDMEGRVDKTYVDSFGSMLRQYGYKTLVYGSASTVFSNPQLNGYWVANYTGYEFMYQHDGVRGTQYASGPDYDLDVWKDWVVPSMWK
jgi:hypothetical protein